MIIMISRETVVRTTYGTSTTIVPGTHTTIPVLVRTWYVLRTDYRYRMNEWTVKRWYRTIVPYRTSYDTIVRTRDYRYACSSKYLVLVVQEYCVVSIFHHPQHLKRGHYFKVHPVHLDAFGNAVSERAARG